MTSYLISPAARRDMDDIWQYIARDSMKHADRVEEAIYRSCRFLAQTPHAGHRHLNVTKRNILFFPVNDFPKYMIVYRPDKHPLSVIAIVHGARDLAARFQ